MNITEFNKSLKIYKNLKNKTNFYIYHNFCRHQNFVRIKTNIYIECRYVPRFQWGWHDDKYLMRYVYIKVCDYDIG